MNPELQSLYDRAVILEGDSNAGQLLKKLYKTSTDELVRKRDNHIEYQRDLEGLATDSISYFKRKIDPLREKYELVDDVAEGRTTFVEKSKKYKLYPPIKNILVYNKNKEILQRLEKEFKPPYNASAELLGEEELKIDNLTRRIVYSGELVCSFATYIYPPIAGFFTFLGILIIHEMIEYGVSGYCSHELDKKFSALYNLGVSK